MIGKIELFLLASATIVIGIALASAPEPSRAVIVNNHLLRIFDIQLNSFNAATQQCSTYGEKIIRMDDESVRRKVYEIIPELKTKWFWIGANREDGNWKWVGDSLRANIDFITWNPGQPTKNNYLVLMNRTTYSTVDKNFSSAGVICQSESTRVVIVNNYLLRFYDIRLSGFNEATQQCSKYGGEIIRMDDESVRRKVYEIIPKLKTKWFWIGAKRENGNWKWVGDSSRANIDFITWNPDHPTNGNCLVLKIGANYSTVKSDFSYAGVICQSDQYCAAQPNICKNKGTCKPKTASPFYSCSCKLGYYGDTCEGYLSVSTKKEVISVVGDENLYISVTVNSTHGGVELSFYNKSNGTFSSTKENNVSTGIYHFKLTEITTKYDGGYSVVAKVYSPAFRQTADFKLVVHEKATVSVAPSFIYSPRITEPYRLTCVANGKPNPTVMWYRAGDLVSKTKTESSVFQIVDDYPSKAYLDVTYAKLSDNGSYYCEAVNIVGSKNRRISVKKYADVAVYGPPVIRSVSSEACQVNGTVELEWTPNNQTTGIVHRIELVSINSTDRHNVSKNTTRRAVIIGHLLPSIYYEMKVIACPDVCIPKLSSNVFFTTGDRLPGKLRSAEVRKVGASFCVVAWKWPEETALNQITRVEVSWTSIPLHTSTTIDPVKRVGVVVREILPPFTEDIITTVPNRIYSAALRAFTCSGAGGSVTAKSSCQTEQDAPAIVEESEIYTSDDGKLPQINVFLPDETNGQISCIFVLVIEGDQLKFNDLHVDFEQLNQAAYRGDNLSIKKWYIALAISRQAFIGTMYQTVLGDNRTTFCDLNLSSHSSPIQAEKDQKQSEKTVLFAKNWPLRSNGASYSYFTVTTTPTTSSEIFRFARSATHYFTYGPQRLVKGPDTSSVALTVAGTLFLVLSICLSLHAIYVRKKWKNEVVRKSFQNLHGERDNSGYENTDIALDCKKGDEQTYEEIGGSGSTHVNAKNSNETEESPYETYNESESN